MKRKFVDFLYDHRVYESFEENCLKDHHVCLDSVTRRHEPRKWVLAAFDWASTEQGEVFWSKINDEWMKVLNYKK